MTLLADKNVKMDKVVSIINGKLKPLASGASMNDVFRLLYHISLLKYSTKDQLEQTHKTAFKVATKPKLAKLVDMGYIDSDNEVFRANAQTYEILKRIRFGTRKTNIELLPRLPKGTGSLNELVNSEYFVEAINLEDYHCLLFPSFGYIRPDTLLVRKREGEYKLTFLEIESSKSNWKDYLSEKRLKYLDVSKDKTVYDYWKNTAPKIDLKVPTEENFKFSVAIVANQIFDFGDGFLSVEKLSELK
jgi:hypothetical protein